MRALYASHLQSDKVDRGAKALVIATFGSRGGAKRIPRIYIALGGGRRPTPPFPPPMPSFFSRHKDTSSPSPEPPVITGRGGLNMPVPEVDGPSNYYDGDDAPSIPPVISLSEGSSSEEDHDIANHLDGAFAAVSGAQSGFQSYTGSRSLRVLNKSGDMLGTIKTDVTNIQGSSLASPLKSAYESEAMKTIRSGVNTLVDNLPGLIKALDEVAKLHPFIGIAVGAFRIVVELDLKRRDNDKKIASLFLQMKDMMEALLQLRSIKDQEAIGPGGMTIKARMQELVKQTADDITSCGNACDTYAKKRLIVKVIKGSVWDSTLKGYIDLFASAEQPAGCSTARRFRILATPATGLERQDALVTSAVVRNLVGSVRKQGRRNV
ncbi:hypothetical protein NUW54_g8639 [Trametes sanguinea]|uniref:Uncharacterized protein n=1 Tax=Trametes sanguinea TaxID=158606 RepID=A0ACC1PBX4_9APHY|nr:hypothetical protein NUW54_g8639 [Trametes sanguinea]